jgi:hypothetical protein
VGSTGTNGHTVPPHQQPLHTTQKSFILYTIQVEPSCVLQVIAPNCVHKNAVCAFRSQQIAHDALPRASDLHEHMSCCARVACVKNMPNSLGAEGHEGGEGC